jgi:hypothetical protein
MATVNNYTNISTPYYREVRGGDYFVWGMRVVCNNTTKILEVHLVNGTQDVENVTIWESTGGSNKGDLLATASVVDGVADFGTGVDITEDSTYWIGLYNESPNPISFDVDNNTPNPNVVCDDLTYEGQGYASYGGSSFDAITYFFEITNIVTGSLDAGSESSSPSNSPSTSPSQSTSPSNSPSTSPSQSTSPSLSTSPSTSPSPGWESYSRQTASTLPTTDADLSTVYTAGEVTDVETKNNVYVDQLTTGEYAIHEFKDFVVSTTGGISFEWYGKSSLAPSVSDVNLQIYNYDDDEWEDVDSDGSTAADTNFSLFGDIADVTNYQQGGVVTCRVWQLAV